MRMHMVAAALVFSPVAVAAPTGPEFGFRAAFSRPFGESVGDGSRGGLSLRDVVRGGIPIWLDLGYRFAPEFYAGVSGSFGLLFPNGCDASDRCSGQDVRLGLDLRFHLAPSAAIDPWIGVGAGYEWLMLSASPGGQDQELTLQGIEFFNVQMGVDFLAVPRFRLGPFVGFSLGRYTEGSASSGLVSASGPIANARVHEWLLLGLRAAFNP